MKAKSLVRHAPAVRAFLSAVSAVFILGCSKDSPSGPQRVTQEIRTDTVRLASDVSTSAKSQVSGLFSLYGEAGREGDTIAVAEGGLLVAANANDQALFMAYTPATGTAEVGARTTAIAAIRMLLQPPFVPAAQVEQLVSQIPSQPGFDALIAEINAHANAGRSFLEVDSTHRKVAGIVNAMAPSTVPSAPVALEQLPIIIADKSGSANFALTNNGFIPFHAVSSNASTGEKYGTAVLQKQDLDATYLVSWLLNAAPKTTDLAGRNGEVRITIGQNAETRRLRHVQLLVDLIEVAFLSLGLPNVKGPVADAVGQIQTLFPILPVALLEEKGWFEVAESFVDDFISTEGLNVFGRVVGKWYFKSLGADRAGKVLLYAAIKNTAGSFYKYATLGLDIATRVPFYAEWATYGGMSEEVEICQADGVIVDCFIGTYRLKTVNGRAVPTVMADDIYEKFEMLGGSITVRVDSTFSMTLNGRYTDKETGLVDTSPIPVVGRYTKDGASLTFKETGYPEVMTGSYVDGKLSFNDGTDTYLFEKP